MEKYPHENNSNFLMTLMFIGIALSISYFYGIFLALYNPEIKGIFQDSALTPFLEFIKFVINRTTEPGWLEYETNALVAMLFSIFGTTGAIAFLYWRYNHIWKGLRNRFYLRRRYGSQHGTAEFSSVNELKKLCGKDGVIVGYSHKQPVRLSLRASCEHTAIIGPTGCGKTSRFFIPNLLELPPNTSAIVTDPKREIAQKTAPYLRSQGWDTYEFCPLDPSTSVTYNPIDLSIDDTEISELAEIMLKNGYSSSGQAGDTQWISFAQPLWEAALLAEKYKEREEGDPRPSIQEAYNMITNLAEEDRAEIFKKLGSPAIDRYLAYLQSAQAPETAASIKTVLVSSIRVFVRPDIESVTSSKKSFNPSILRSRPSILYIQIPERKAHLMKPLSATMYWQITEHIVDREGLPIVFFLDEFPNIGQIPGFSQLAATLRSRNISLNIGLQGIEQLSREYSKEEQMDILNNMKTKIYFPGSTGESGEYTSSMSGYSTFKQDGANQRRELLSSDELRRIPDNNVLLLAHNLNPVMLQSIPYFRNRKMLAKSS